MSRFRGRFSHSLDKKGRASIPVKFRDALRKLEEETLILSYKETGCLEAYPLMEWERWEDTVGQLSNLNEATRKYKLFFMASAQECSVDTHGRILIPPDLRNQANLGEKVRFVGMREHFEIWDESAYEAKLKEISDNLSDVVAQVDQLATSKGI